MSPLSKNKPQKKPKQSTTSSSSQSFLGSFLQTLKDIFTDKGVVLLLIMAPIIYGFFYPWPYSTEVVNHVPVGIIDKDNSNLSRTIVRYASASPQLNTQRFVNEQDAIEAMWSDQIAGYMVIPSGLEQQVLSGKAASVSVLGNGGYFILNKNVQLGFLKAVSTVSAGIEVKKSVAQGAYSPTAAKNTQAIPLQIIPLYNQTEGYGAYVVPAVSIIILQQTLLMATAMLIGTWYEQRRHMTTIRGWLGRIGALSMLSFIIGCFYYGWAFELHHYPRGQNMAGSLLFLLLFCPTVATLGCLLGLWFRQRERSMQILIFSSLPLFFISGYPWPADQLPEILQLVRWLVPTTPAINTSVQLNQMGASVAQVAMGFYALAGLWAFYFALLLLFRWRTSQKQLPHKVSIKI
ncbi:ABC transporter permease [Psychrobacter sp. W2-37-MNA-CIBAN-0211]|uniref:ABC transporter permease n=1 Tax=Psychrobacter sp. W2-37-MNA-CIBAN-0211 TaxID=3140443 RepID=UPI003332EAC6